MRANLHGAEVGTPRARMAVLVRHAGWQGIECLIFPQGDAAHIRRPTPQQVCAETTG